MCDSCQHAKVILEASTFENRRLQRALDDQNEISNKIISAQHDDLRRLEAENKRLREALAGFADAFDCDERESKCTNNVCCMMCEEARKALEVDGAE